MTTARRLRERVPDPARAAAAREVVLLLSGKPTQPDWSGGRQAERRAAAGGHADIALSATTISRAMHSTTPALIASKREGAYKHFQSARGGAHRSKYRDERAISIAGSMGELLTGAAPASVSARQKNAERHIERLRGGPKRKPRRDSGKAPASGEKFLERIHSMLEESGPTRSVPLNVFLRRIEEATFARARAMLPDDEKIVLVLLERARREMVSTLVHCGTAEMAIAFIMIIPKGIQTMSDAGAFVVSASSIASNNELGALAREYVRAHAARDARLATAIMAAFAGTIVRYAEEQRGPHVRQALLHDLTKRIDLWTRKRLSQKRPRRRS